MKATNEKTKDEYGEHAACLENTAEALVSCIILNNDYIHDSSVLEIAVPNKYVAQLLHILPTIFLSSKAFSSEFSHIELWFTWSKL